VPRGRFIINGNGISTQKYVEVARPTYMKAEFVKNQLVLGRSSGQTSWRHFESFTKLCIHFQLQWQATRGIDL